LHHFFKVSSVGKRADHPFVLLGEGGGGGPEDLNQGAVCVGGGGGGSLHHCSSNSSHLPSSRHLVSLSNRDYRRRRRINGNPPSPHTHTHSHKLLISRLIIVTFEFYCFIKPTQISSHLPADHDGGGGGGRGEQSYRGDAQQDADHEPPEVKGQDAGAS